MTERRPYTYVVLRYRHDPLVEEFANVGVVMHAARLGFLKGRFRRTVGRLTKIFPDLDSFSFKSSLQRLSRHFDRLKQTDVSSLLTYEYDASTFASRVLPHDDSSFVWSKTGSGLTSDPEATLNSLYRRFVSRYDEVIRASRDDAAVWRPVRDRLKERHLSECLHPKTISSEYDVVEFEHAWKNGAWHCYQPLSFDLASADSIREKAARWAGHMLALSRSDEHFRAYFFVGMPKDARLMAAYESAVGLLELSPNKPRVVPETQIDDFVAQIEDEMRAHRTPAIGGGQASA